MTIFSTFTKHIALDVKNINMKIISMHKMTVKGNSYINDFRRSFNGAPVTRDMLNDVCDFAYEMCFGAGHHRLHRTGGQVHRKGGEQFCNVFQGKLAEVVLRKSLISIGLPCREADFNVYGEGVWDDTDLNVNGKSLSVKSAAFFSNLLLLESHDYDNLGNYLPNLNIGATASYDYYVLVRIKPDIKDVFRKERLMYSNNIDKETASRIVRSQDWYFDIAGWISHHEFVSVIRNKNIIPQNALLNDKIPMDAENYYVQSGDMHTFQELYDVLK